jgi:invasion protein IalB
MNHRLVSAPARPAARAFAVAAATTMLTALIGSGALAQSPPAPAAPKAAPKAAAPKAAPAQKPAAAPAPPHAQAQGQPPAGEQPQLIFSPWTKFCLKGQEANAKQVCFTGKDGRVESGMPVVAAVLIEPENDPKKVLRVTLPLGMSLQPGTRVIVDNGQPMTGPYVICFNNGCMADYEASGELIGKLKKGQGLVIQGINGAGQPISLVVPLTDFAKAYDGPPTDPKKFEEQQKQLQEELQKRAEEARKKLEAQPPSAQQAAPSR